ncbi:polysaccharide deacetylase family protein [Polymorphobacter fuscus]|uniref:Chitooligosaccharide deacetylase n=1 Tax=Sandarakinorhabdus fusca TaxID=1439888 RepID=A0A7C9KK26_9SPHN|nr:polysaccharide deacetylase family protein [Polymorphobacter fuscus]KAB7644096.1 polysaccharide deacetylase family protein [Polymorphobacter fuscus]MQT18479.1 polysaccharide deacetylase family protein [Polymorphobacter fuscus]NJC08400.1 peptidoglycan/xylan/chitin deacetylase (PgdA/CDA1 family) [Polymorphobacter fuscus]
MRTAAILCAMLATAAGARPVIAPTFDDLPAHGALPPGETRAGVAGAIIAALKQARVPGPHGFVNGALVGADPAPLAMWRAAGFPIGNHGWSHANLDVTPVADYVADIDRNAVPGDGRWFRFPFLAEGKDPKVRQAVRTALAERGYRIAAVTMSFGDFLWNDAYARCAGDPAAVAVLERSYLAAASEAAAASRAAARQRHGRDIPYVLLLHVGAFDARLLPRLLAQYRREGFGFTTLARAQRDPAYASDTDPARPPVPALPLPQVHNYGPMLAALCRPEESAR